MTALDFSRCRLQPFRHQKEDVEWLMERPYAFIASAMRTGKTKIVVDAAQFLFEAGEVDTVIVVAPAPVRDVWSDQTLGEIAKHAWLDVPHHVVEYHTRLRAWTNIPNSQKYLRWYITNYEFIRSAPRLAQLLVKCGPRTLLVGDESSFVKTVGTLQTKAFMELRKRCGRVVLLNGTPIFHSPLDLLSQGNLLSKSILAVNGNACSKSLFIARYAIQKPVLTHGGKPLVNPRWPGKPIMQVDGWTNLEDIERRFAPCTVRRLQSECEDMPVKLDPVTLTATLTPATWAHYKAMREDFVVWLNDNQVVTSATAAVKALRLSQITGGFLSGVEAAGIDPVDAELLDSIQLPGSFLDGLVLKPEGAVAIQAQTQHFNDVITSGSFLDTNANAVEIGREKLDVLLWFIEQRLEADLNLHLVAWSRFRAEVFRAEREVKKRFPQFQTALIVGGQKKQERLEALALLKPETSPTGPVFVAGIEGTGSFGLDMTAAHTCVTLSSGYSPGKSAQTLDRVYGPGQKHPIAYYDIIAVGPKGQRTIDHDILTTRRTGEGIATRTAAAWVKALKEE